MPSSLLTVSLSISGCKYCWVASDCFDALLARTTARGTRRHQVTKDYQSLWPHDPLQFARCVWGSRHQTLLITWSSHNLIIFCGYHLTTTVLIILYLDACLDCILQELVDSVRLAYLLLILPWSCCPRMKLHLRIHDLLRTLSHMVDHHLGLDSQVSSRNLHTSFSDEVTSWGNCWSISCSWVSRSC
jgi:hypothetical protein